MKSRHLVLILLVIFTCSKAYSQPRASGKLTVQLATGPQTFTANNIPLFFNAENREVRFYFKAPYFTSGDSAKDKLLYNLLLAGGNGEILFKGRLALKPMPTKEGKQMSTFASGTLRWAGTDLVQQLPVTITRRGSAYRYKISALLDMGISSQTQAQAKIQAIKQPLLLELQLN